MQFDVFPNPEPRTRGAFPYLAVLQADVAETGDARMTAPLIPLSGMRRAVAGRVTPTVSIGDADFILAIPQMTAIRTRSLRDRVGSIARHRDAVTAALDYLFQGI